MILNAITAILCAFITTAGTIWAVRMNTKVNNVHELVNNQLDTVMNKNIDLTAQVKYEKTQPAEEP
jgi:hypothetical protein